LQLLSVVFPEWRLFAGPHEFKQFVLHEFKSHLNGLLQSLLVSFGAEQEHADAFFFEPVEQALFVKVVLGVNFMHFLKNR
jgi:hypothetical protein